MRQSDSNRFTLSAPANAAVSIYLTDLIGVVRFVESVAQYAFLLNERKNTAIKHSGRHFRDRLTGGALFNISYRV